MEKQSPIIRNCHLLSSPDHLIALANDFYDISVIKIRLSHLKRSTLLFIDFRIDWPKIVLHQILILFA